MKRLVVVGVALLVFALLMVLTGCATRPSAPVSVPVTTTTPYVAPTYEETPAPTYSETPEPVFTPNEKAYVKAALKAWGITFKVNEAYRQMLIDTGWNICSLLDTDPSMIDGLIPRPSRRAALIKASTTYLCP